MTHLKKACFAILFSSLTLFGCGSGSNSQTNDKNTPLVNSDASTVSSLNKGLKTYQWTLDSAVDGQKQTLTDMTAIKEQIKLSFTSDANNKDTVSFDVDCNANSAIYQLNNSTLTTQSFKSDEKYCAGLTEVEQTLFQSMVGESQITLTKEASDTTATLTIVTANSSTFTWKGTSVALINANNDALNQKLLSYDWQLKSAVDTKNQTINELESIKAQVVLVFGKKEAEKTIYFSVGCNNFNGNYRFVNDAEINVSAPGTEKLCADLNGAEQRLDAIMNDGSSQVSVEQGNEVLLTQTGGFGTLVWIGTPKTAS